MSTVSKGGENKELEEFQREKRSKIKIENKLKCQIHGKTSWAGVVMQNFRLEY